MENKQEVWLRGEKIEGISPLLQPIADAYLEAIEEIESFVKEVPENLLWEKVADSASVGFHLQHIVGFLDRLYTYADGIMLSDEQKAYLRSEGLPDNHSIADLFEKVKISLQNSIEKLKTVPENILSEPRFVGRAKLPTTVIGLYFHSAEHLMRHTGQLLVTCRVLKLK